MVFDQFFFFQLTMKYLACLMFLIVAASVLMASADPLPHRHHHGGYGGGFGGYGGGFGGYGGGYGGYGGGYGGRYGGYGGREGGGWGR